MVDKPDSGIVCAVREGAEKPGSIRRLFVRAANSGLAFKSCPRRWLSKSRDPVILIVVTRFGQVQWETYVVDLAFGFKGLDLGVESRISALD